ncbi:MAG: hypothetical protein IPK76_13040 [Lewinellaceae bacterium]|nr:hypothetical protein [Lewinellaceae bacterium]
MTSSVKLFADEQIILFLRNLQTVNFFVQNLQTGEVEHDRSIHRTDKDNLIGLQLAQKGEIKKQTQWLVRHFQVEIPEDVRQSIQEEDKRICPDKLKQATFIEIGLAAKVKLDKGVLIPLKYRVPIYNYLPTEHNHDKFSYLVNSNFLIDPARKDLLQKRWNYFLFEQIGYLQFEWFREMHTDERFRFDFTDLIVRYASNTNDPFNASINRGVDKAIQEVAFVPVLPNEEKSQSDDAWLRRTTETIVDKTHLSDYEEERQTVRMAFEKPFEIADPAIKNIGRLISFGANAFDHHKLANVIRTTGHFRQPETNARLVNFLHDRIAALADHDCAEWNNELLHTPFLLTMDTSMLEPREVYLEGLTEQLPFTADLPILHPEVNRLTVKERKEVENWLIKLKAAYPKPLDIIRKTVFGFVQKDEITIENTIPVLRYVFSQRALLDESDYKVFAGLKIRTQKNSLLLPRHCHLADYYEPGLPLEQVLEEDIFVHEHYPEDENTVPDWNRFFVHLGVKQEMEILEYEGYHKAGDLRKKGFGDYIDYLLDEELPPINRNANHGIHHFVSVDFYKYLTNPTFARSFWQILLEQKWQNFRTAARKCQFYHSAGKVPAPTYFQYFVSRHPSFPATDGLCYPTEEIYSKSLEPIIKNLLPVSYFEMTLDQEEIFGLRSDLAAEDCLELLEKLTAEDSGSIDITHFESIYKYIASLRFSETEQLMFRKWAETHTLPSTDGGLRPIPQLYYLDIPQHARKSNTAYTIWLPSDATVALEVAGVFGISVIIETDLVLEEGHCSPDCALREFITSKLSWLAIIKAFRAQRAWQEVRQEMQEQIDSIKMLKSNELKLVYWSGDELVYEKKVWSWTIDETLYYVEPHEDNLTRVALIESLARILSMEDSLKEINIMFSLDNDQLQIWAENEGFEVPKVKKRSASILRSPPQGQFLKEAQNIRTTYILTIQHSVGKGKNTYFNI